MLKRLEIIAKTLLAVCAAALFWRPGRRLRAEKRLATARRVLLVRVDNRVGEALLMTPLLDALHGRFEVDVLVHQKMVRVLEGHLQVRRVLGLNRRWLALGALAPGIRPLRAQRYDAVINCANWEVPSVTQALVSRLCAGHGTVVGPSVGIGAALMDVAVDPAAGTTSELTQRLHLLAPLGIDLARAPLSFRPTKTGAAIESLLQRLRTTPYAVVNPGGRLDWRRVPAEVFAAACRALSARGVMPLVTWGPGETALATSVVQQSPGAQLAPPTTLDELAALMRPAALTVCNNTGPMHLSVAVGTPTVALFLRMPIERWGYPFAPHTMVELSANANLAEMQQQVTRALQK